MSNSRIAWLTPADPPGAFPHIDSALVEPDGLLAAGGDLSCDRIVEAYTRGIFPWYDEGQPILWWSPDPRCVMRLDEFHLSRRFLRDLRHSAATVSFNTAFEAVITGCAAPRDGQAGTWITDEMHEAYCRLHRDGYAHCVEVWQNEKLVGGLYGLAIGKVFFAESMYSRQSGASKIALAALVRTLAANGFALIDCQVASAHLMTLGASLLPRTRFVAILSKHTADRAVFNAWPEARIAARDLRAC